MQDKEVSPIECGGDDEAQKYGPARPELDGRQPENESDRGQNLGDSEITH